MNFWCFALNIKEIKIKIKINNFFNLTLGCRYLYLWLIYFVNENVWVIFFLCKGSPCDKNWNKFNLMAYNNFFSNKKGQQKYYRGTCLWWKGHRWKEYTRTFKKRREKYKITCWRCWPKKVNLLDFFPIFELCEAKNTAD